MFLARRHTILTLVAAGAATLLLAGCGSDSSGPKASAASKDAAHYDSIAGAVIGSNADQGAAIEVFNGVIADGTVPTNASVTLNGSSTTWFADYVNLVDSAQADSQQVITLWSSTNADSIILFFFLDAQIGVVQTIALDGGLDNYDAGASTVSGTFGAPSGSCSFTTIQNVYGHYPTYDPAQSTCQRESASGTASVTMGTSGTVTDSIHTFAFTSQTVNGVRLQFTSAAAFSSAVAKILAASAGAPTAHLLGRR
jgi:hypothetical protein